MFVTVYECICTWYVNVAACRGHRLTDEVVDLPRHHMHFARKDQRHSSYSTLLFNFYLPPLNPNLAADGGSCCHFK